MEDYIGKYRGNRVEGLLDSMKKWLVLTAATFFILSSIVSVASAITPISNNEPQSYEENFTS